MNVSYDELILGIIFLKTCPNSFSFLDGIFYYGSMCLARKDRRSLLCPSFFSQAWQSLTGPFTPLISDIFWPFSVSFNLMLLSYISWNPSIYNIIRWVAWTMGQTNRRLRVWCSKYHFFLLFVDLGHSSKLFIFIL